MNGGIYWDGDAGLDGTGDSVGSGGEEGSGREEGSETEGKDGLVRREEAKVWIEGAPGRTPEVDGESDPDRILEEPMDEFPSSSLGRFLRI